MALIDKYTQITKFKLDAINSRKEYEREGHDDSLYKTTVKINSKIHKDF